MVLGDDIPRITAEHLLARGRPELGALA